MLSFFSEGQKKKLQSFTTLSDCPVDFLKKTKNKKQPLKAHLPDNSVQVYNITCNVVFCDITASVRAI